MTTSTPTPGLTRRSLVRSGLGLGAAAGIGSLSLASCSNEGRGGAAAGDNASVTRPDYIPFDGVALDLEGDEEAGISGAMLNYPEDPQPVHEGTPGDGKDIGFFVPTNTPAPPGHDSNVFWQELDKRLGCTTAISVVPTGDFADRFNTAIAGDRLPDIFSFFPGDVPSLPSMLAERATDLTDLLSGGAVADYPFLANVPPKAWDACIYGGKIFAIPVPRGVVQTTVLFARRDLLDSEGLEVDVSSLESFLDSCKELTGGNRWALPQVPLGFLRQMFEVPNGWSGDADGLTSAHEHEGQEPALEAARRLVQEGLTHPDAFTVDQPQRKTWIANGTTPLIFDTMSAWPDFGNFPLPDGFLLEVLQPPLAEGGGVAPVHMGPSTHNITSISKKSEDRAAALLDVLNYIAAPFGTAEHLFLAYGTEGVHHELRGSNPVLTETGRSELQLSQKYMAQGPWVHFNAKDSSVSQAQYDASMELGPTATRNPVEGLFSETQSRKGRQIGTALGDLETDIIQGRKPVSAWSEAVATWKKNGGDAIRDEFQKALGEKAEG
ncbi:extracellular solute-binding protein [Brachybacterium hainanense]|uniref:Extracellular solute-binding protein n=1 Tax=Brachybacterium hainanense TaxID=1541174 RepID=A0ABV6RC93_9MICO